MSEPDCELRAGQCLSSASTSWPQQLVLIGQLKSWFYGYHLVTASALLLMATSKAEEVDPNERKNRAKSLLLSWDW